MPISPGRAVPKPTYKRKAPKRVNRGKFSPATIKHIFERDEWRCVRCRRSNDLDSVPHHIIFKSQCGPGTKDNGCVVCLDCHDWAHGKRKGPNGEMECEGRKWFEQYRIKVLLPYYGMSA